MSRIGVTRVADSTDLDDLGIPVFSAIRPTDAGMAGISVYNGKGSTKPESLAGALMEAIERYCGEIWPNQKYRGTFAEISARYNAVLDPAVMHLQEKDACYSGETLDWGECWDLISNSPILVPINFIICPYEGPLSEKWYSSSNGLASGNNIEEAICHALAELIERDAYTLAMVRAQLKPKFSAFVKSINDSGQMPSRIDVDRSAFPLIDLDTLPHPVSRLVRFAQRNGAKLWLRNITSDTGIPTFVASIQEIGLEGDELASGGFGCHPNAAVAATRAITEAAQGRIVQIQGTREDATQIGNYAGGERVLWCNDEGAVVPFESILSYEHTDILDDISLMLRRLKACQITKVIVADVSDTTMSAKVVRVIIPQLESWMLTDFAADKCNLGFRAKRCLLAASAS